MLFNSLKFLLFFPIVTIIYFLIPQKYKHLWLLLASYYFYMSWNPEYALLIGASTVITYLSGLAINKATTEKSRKLTVGISFGLNLLILFYFKYFYFTIDNINAVRALFHLPKLIPHLDVILPVGISFYTFQALSYTMDVYRQEIEPERNFFKYALFVSFFPQLVAGPIERSKNLIRQINEEHHFDYYRVRYGLLMMLWGFFLKLVIADRAAILVDSVYDNMSMYTGAQIAIATIFFALQIYCDFASYSIIAQGAAKVMGFELMKNFNMPYFSTTIADFWRNWHISLSTWFKDYLYIPLGGNRKGELRKYLNLMIVFLASGLWHGAGMHFVVWGAVHGIYQIIGGVTRDFRENLSKLFGINRDSAHYKWFQRCIVFILVSFAWIFFRSASIADAFSAIGKICSEFKPWSLYDSGIIKMGLNRKNLIVLGLSAGILFFISLAKSKQINPIKYVEDMHLFARWTVYLALIFIVLIFGIYGPGFSQAQFIYFQF